MNAKTAKTILAKMMGNDFTERKLDGGMGVWARAGEAMASFDGDFSADELEAIAAWMRDPEGVTNA